MSSGGGPGGNKWAWFKIDGMTGDQIGQQLNALAQNGYYEQYTVVKAKDGTFFFLGNYSD